MSSIAHRATEEDHAVAEGEGGLSLLPVDQRAGGAVAVTGSPGGADREAFNRLRMKRAEDMLHDPRGTLEGISNAVGFSNAANLSRAMKAHFGVTPRVLRTRRVLE